MSSASLTISEDNNMINITEITQLMASLGVAKSSDLIGVTEKDIQSLEEYLGAPVPLSYQEFLRHMGRSAGYLSPWMAIYFDDLKEIREQFDLLNATLATPATLPPYALIIANWESVFDFFICNGNNDPEILRIDLCHESGPHQKSYAPSYSQYLENLVRSANTQEIPNDLLEDDEQTYAEDIISY